MPLTITDIDLDAEEGIWEQAYGDRANAVDDLVTSMKEQVQVLGGGAWLTLLSKAAGSLSGTVGGDYVDDIKQLARVCNVSRGEILLANMLYELSSIGPGCSTLIQPRACGPIHARNLDWPWPDTLLQRTLTVLRFNSEEQAGYATITWPGLFGAFTGFAPGRFSVTINACYCEALTPWQMAQRVFKGYWPATWLVRAVLDQADDYNEAVKMLSGLPVLTPVIYAVAGVENEGVIIERKPLTYAIRKCSAGKTVFATNHFMSPEMIPADRRASGRVELGESTGSRYMALQTFFKKHSVNTEKQALRLLQHRDIFDDEITQHQVVMTPATGEMLVCLPGKKPKQIFVEG